MKIELIIFLITGLFMYNTYYDNFLTKSIKSYEKYIRITGILFIGLSLYIFFKKNPSEKKNFALYASEAIKYAPIDRKSKQYFSPLLTGAFSNKQKKRVHFNPTIENVADGREEKIKYSGKNSNKRSVSQAKKKFVAARQKWSCNDCKQILDASFEVDHIVELQHGGNNHIDNLVALCRNCHGKKTMLNHI
jgi:5-methylcytosine-specific restriction endonuclease McrA